MRVHTNKTRLQAYTKVTAWCDLCGRAAARGRLDGGADWDSSFDGYDHAETEIRLFECHETSDGGHGRETSVDLCPRCFKTILLPWLRGRGARVEERETDW